jgi:murein DD-endopeptidase MepM/ murein hydrolase activator NlpD
VAIENLIKSGLVARLVAKAPEREIFLRTGGNVRFLRITTRAQLIAAGIVAAAALVWLAITLFMLVNQASVVVERAELARDRSSVTSKAAQVNAYKRSVDEIARDIEDRQEALDNMVRSHLGPIPGNSAVVGKADTAPTNPASSGRTSNASPEMQKLERLRARQDALASHIVQAAQARLNKVEAAIRSFGLDPARLASASAQGGPFIPIRGVRFYSNDPALQSLEALLGRLQAMETTLAVLPSARPTNSPALTSSYGFRRDPFNGMPAFHAGIDFPGAYRQPILAAAAGTVRFVGTHNGYGRVIEVDHGGGIMTRYAHLAGFNARVGQKVDHGETIGMMGSTGRSTGVHLHFEVRINGAAVDPRPFLEARQDVLEVQQLAQRRIAPRDRS